MSRRRNQSLLRLIEAGYAVTFLPREEGAADFEVKAQYRGHPYAQAEGSTLGKALQELLRKTGLHR